MTIFLTSCSAFKINTVSKNRHVSGIKSGKNYINYSIKVTSDKDFSIQNIEIENNDTKLKYYYLDLQTKLSSSIIKPVFTKGSYLFSFRIDNMKGYNSDQYILIKYSIDNKYFTKKHLISKTKDRIGK